MNLIKFVLLFLIWNQFAVLLNSKKQKLKELSKNGHPSNQRSFPKSEVFCDLEGKSDGPEIIDHDLFALWDSSSSLSKIKQAEPSIFPNSKRFGSKGELEPVSSQPSSFYSQKPTPKCNSFKLKISKAVKDLEWGLTEPQWVHECLLSFIVPIKLNDLFLHWDCFEWAAVFVGSRRFKGEIREEVLIEEPRSQKLEKIEETNKKKKNF